ncbi:MAG: GspE/PulE family protein [bacterium]
MDYEMIDFVEPFEKLLENSGVSFQEVKKRSEDLGIPPLEVIVNVLKIFDYDQIAKRWSEIYNIPYYYRDKVIEVKDWYIVVPKIGTIDDTVIGVWHPKYYAMAKRQFPDKDVYIMPFALFQIKNIEETGLYGEFIELVKAAINLGATDIHFEIRNEFVEIKLRLYGDLRNYMSIDLKHGYKLIKTIKNESAKWTPNIDVEEWRERQDSRIVIPDLKLDLRLAFTPSLQDGYQNLVIRLLSKSLLRIKGVEDLISLGYSKEDVNALLRTISFENGINIMSGATGSGKSRTINTILALIPNTKKILTIEDPVEYFLENAVQHQVLYVEKENGKKIDMNYLEYLRAFMRQDPDVIFVGEWRKIPALTEALLYASETGHLVFTTLHSSRIVNVPNLLVNQYGVKPEDISNNVNILINQRLVKTICKSCGIPHVITEEDLKDVAHLRFKDRDKLYSLVGKEALKRNKEGCEYCKVLDKMSGQVLVSGYAGRTAMYEYVLFDEEIREVVLKSTSSLTIEELVVNKVKEGKSKTFVDVAIDKVLNKEISLQDALSKLS